MISYIYKRAFNILMNMPLKLWGLSLLSGFLTILVLIFGVLPIISIPVIVTINAGMAVVYLDGYSGKDVYSDQLFASFKNFPHVAGGMCWKNLWLLLWLLIPVAGPIIAVIKSLSYAFTPYILTSEKDVNATEALRKSMHDTNGYKLNMFAATILPIVAFAVVMLVLNLLGLVPFIGLLFRMISFIVSLVYGLVAPLFLGLVQAGFYEYAKKPLYSDSQTQASYGPKVPCPSCGHENPAETKFCGKCGSKL